MDLTVLAGPNFSGRTARLRAWAGLGGTVGAEPETTGHAYVGPDPIDGLSGLAPTVSAEFELAAEDGAALKAVLAAADNLGFGYILGRNPFSLSGGEQVIAATLAAAAGRPKRLAIDCALEQLAASTRTALLDWLRDWDGELMIADNRLDEWYDGSVEKLEGAPDAPMIQPDLQDEVTELSPEIEICGLAFSYPRGPRVFAGFDLKLVTGQAYHLRGENGSGKSTLSKLLCGLLKPDAGEIKVNGECVKPWRTPGSFVSYHFQNPSFQLFSRTVAAELGRATHPERTAENYGLSTFLDVHPLDLPFVLRKRVAVAAAVDRDLRFLVLDEPTLAQDRANCDRLHSALLGRGGLRISHSTQMAGLPSIVLDRQGGRIA